MNAIPVTPATLEIARRVMWFEPPEKALAHPARFLAYAMTYARHEDMRVIRRYLSDDDLREALDGAPPGIIDPRSWAYWNSKMGRYPAPPLPQRTFEAAGQPAASIRQSLAGGANRAQKLTADELQRRGRTAWQQIRQQRPESDPEEVRRRARQEWLDKYGPKERE
jgi:hypothetical protein